MKTKAIKVLKVSPGEPPVTCELKNNLTSLQEAVSIGTDYKGLIEIISLDERICILCNEEGKLNGMQPNRRVGYDIICGVFYVAGQDEEGNLTSLTEAEVKQYKARFKNPEYFIPGEEEEALFMSFFPI